MSVYAGPIATAQKLIDKFGRTCYWQKPAPITTTVPGYPEVGDLPDRIECRMAFFSPRNLDRGVLEFLGVMADSEVPESTQIGLLAGGIEFDPENTDHIYFSADPDESEGYSVIKVDRIAPSGEAVLYFVTVAA